MHLTLSSPLPMFISLFSMSVYTQQIDFECTVYQAPLRTADIVGEKKTQLLLSLCLQSTPKTEMMSRHKDKLISESYTCCEEYKTSGEHSKKSDWSEEEGHDIMSFWRAGIWPEPGMMRNQLWGETGEELLDMDPRVPILRQRSGWKKFEDLFGKWHSHKNILCLLIVHIYLRRRKLIQKQTNKQTKKTTLSSHLKSGTLGYQQFQAEQRAQEKGTKAKLVWLSQELECVKKQRHE